MSRTEYPSDTFLMSELNAKCDFCIQLKNIISFLYSTGQFKFPALADFPEYLEN